MQQSKKTSTRESGVSEVIGAVLLISIGVTAAAVIGVAVLSQPTPVNVPALDAIISSVGHTIQIYHNGGDTLQSAAIQILVDGTAEPFQKGTDSSWQSWSIGETLTYVDPNPNGAKSVQIVYTGASSPAILASAYFGQNGMPLASRTITATAGTGGTISPYGTVGVIYGDSQQFNITPNTGYHIANVAVDGSSVGAVPAYTFPSVTSDHSISATFAINQYTIIPSAIGNGAINPNTPQTVNYSATPSFTFTPNANYQLSFVTVDGSNVTPSGNSYTFPPVTANHAISATFAIQTYMINATAGSNGAISPSGMVNVNSGANQSFTITNSTGYSISNVLVDGVPNGSISGYTFTNVQANHTISATFAGLTYTINATAGSNGAISPSGIVNVSYGATPTFTFTPNTGYYLSTVTVDGNPVTPSGSSYTFPPVTASHTISATFAINMYTITATAGPNGAISPPGIVNVSYGAGQGFTITPNTGFYTASILVNGIPVVGPPESGNPAYTFSNVTVNQTISATFNATQTVTGISPAAGPLGGGMVVTISGSGFTGVTAVRFGGNAATSYTFTNDTSIKATAPAAGSIGTVDITIIINNIVSATSSADRYTYTTPLTAIGAITGTTTVGSTLTAGALTPSGATATYQWQYSTSPTGTYTAISGATGSTYIVGSGYVGDYIEVVATGTGSYTGSVTSVASSQVTAPLTAIGAISGTPQFGSTLTAGALTPSGATATYQWQYSTSPTGTYTAISGATSSTYTVAATYVGDYIEVVATGSGGYTGSVNSVASSQVTAITITAIGAISGTPQFGSTLAAGALTPSGATATYQWQYSTTSGGTYTAISGATSSTYTVAATYVGDYIKVVATGSGGYTGSVTSVASSQVTAITITAIGAISGTPQFGSTLTAGALTPSGATATYQWQYSTTSGGTYTAISGATSSTYTVAATYVGDYIKVVATGSGGYAGSVTSVASSQVTAITITAIGAISGTPHVGTALTAGALTPSGATATYQWQRSPTSGGTYTAISGATSTTYTPVAGDGGYYIEVVATGTGGYTGAVTSVYAGPVTIVPVIQTFTSSGTSTVPQGAVSVQYCVVGGGGGGGHYGGGGGAGGFLTGTLTGSLSTSYTVTVGGGGNGATTATAAGASGIASVFSTISAAGGGGGGTSSTTASVHNGANGGSGGGGVRSGSSGGTGTSGQGNNGGVGNTNGGNYLGGGGGGAGAAGSAATTTVAGNGGAGSTCPINSVIYAGGGGGGADSTHTAGGGGSGGGGAGSSFGAGTIGTANTGGGGGGGNNGGGGNGGAGGSGIVILYYS
ncbi:MAG: glycine-rich domain-containing protein [Methanoregula sp.]|uniref:beta strand repeat-containing protein n=1 Tax=Methanoregula sp. TaxID=2052170 RepID=UPI003D113113